MPDLGLTDDQLEAIRAVLAAFPAVTEAKIYGSRAKGTATCKSDIDLAVLGENLERLTLGRIDLNLKDTDIPYPIDVVHYESIGNAELKAHIDRLGVSIYRAE